VLCEGTQYDEDIVSNEIFIGQLLALPFLYVISHVVEEAVTAAAATAACCVMDLQSFCGDFSVNLIDMYDG
jgi:hypothetical protein